MGVKVFKLEHYKGNNYAMHCDEKWKAKVFCNYLISKNRRWNSGNSYSNTRWSVYEGDTIYLFNKGLFSFVSDSLTTNILEFDDFIFEGENWE